MPIPEYLVEKGPVIRHKAFAAIGKDYRFLQLLHKRKKAHEEQAAHDGCESRIPKQQLPVGSLSSIDDAEYLGLLRYPSATIDVCIHTLDGWSA